MVGERCWSHCDTDLSGQEWGKNIRNIPDENPSNKWTYYPPDLYNQHGAKRNNCPAAHEYVNLREKVPEESNNPHDLLLPSAYFTLEIREVLGYFPPVKLKTFFKRRVLVSAEISSISIVAGRNSCFETNMVLMLWFPKTQNIWYFLNSPSRDTEVFKWCL